MTMNSMLAALVLLGVPAVVAAAPEREYISAPRAATPAPLPFSDAVRVGDTLYISGTIGIDSKTGHVAADATAEARQVMENFKATVMASGFTMDDLVSLQVYCTDLALFDAFNSVYRGYFPKGFPARAFIGAKDLVLGAHFEVLGVAVRLVHPG